MARDATSPGDPSSGDPSCCGHGDAPGPVSRRRFLEGVGGAALWTGLAPAAGTSGRERASSARVEGRPLPVGRPLRVLPVLMVHIDRPREQTSWRSYGGIQSEADVRAEHRRIGAELRELAAGCEFPVELRPLVEVRSEEAARRVAETDVDAIILFAASGWTNIVNAITASKAPTILFIRHRSGPFYLWYEIAHWRYLRQNGDTVAVENMTDEDIVVDDWAEVRWRLRALYGLANARGTTMLAIGGLVAYSAPAQENGPRVARELWGYRIETVSEEDFGRRLQSARADARRVASAERQADELIATPNVTLGTERRFVVSSFLALGVCEDLMRETGATNFGFGRCMGHEVISLLGTPPCLILSLANDRGHTAYCHTDLSHTFPGVLMRWIASRPTFVCNSHFPHDGIFTVAHCAAPRKMNGRDYEPAALLTHFESDFGAACRVEYTRGQVVTAVVPNLRCTRWQGFRGRVEEVPEFPACRSQIEIAIDGDWRRLRREMEGFHTQVIYGDYLREIGYALRRLGGIEWDSFTDVG